MSLTSPRVSSAIAILVLIIYTAIIVNGGEEVQNNEDLQLVFLLVFGALITIAAFNFASRELKETEGVVSVIELGWKKFIGISLFSILIAIGYDSLILILVEVFTKDETPRDISVNFISIVVLVLIIYPFFQFLFLAKPGEDSSIPAEYIMEKIMEYVRDVVRSPLIASIIVYSITYIVPIIILIITLDVSIPTALLLWAIVLPLVSLGALAGAGIGEDLIRLRLIRNPATDWPKLGMPKIKLSLKDPQFDVGGFFLVVFAIQAVITTAIFGILNLITAMGVRKASLGALGIQALLLALFNKGRGSTKEMKEVWSEGGFKVSTFQLFLPVYVFLGVILSSVLEVFVSQEEQYGVLAELGLNDHISLALVMLAIQNFVFLFTAIYIFRRPPGTAERRLIKEVSKFYGEDVSGYLFIYKKLKSDRSVENLMHELATYIRKNPEQAALLKGLLKETLTTGSASVQTAASETLLTIIEKQDRLDPDYYELVQLALNSEHTGARIYAVRSMKISLGWLDGEAKEEAIKSFHEKMKDQDPVISWDTSIALQRITLEEPEYRNFILALMIKTLIKTKHEGTLNAINRFLHRVSRENSEVGQMSISILGVQLSYGETENIGNIIAGIRSIIRANPYLSSDLIDIIAVGIESPDEEDRKDSYLVLTNLAEYGSGQDDEILQLILKGVNDESIEIQKISYDALSKDVSNHPDLLEEIFTILISKFTELRGIPLLGALDVIESIVKIENQDINNEIYNLIKGASNSSTPAVRASVFGIMAVLAVKSPNLADDIFFLTEENISHENEDVREKAIIAMGEAVTGNHELARAVYRKIKDARNDDSARVQLAAIEALGHVASASKQYSDEIFDSLQPLLTDNDWQVRLAALNGLFAASKGQSKLIDNLVKEAAYALTDNDRTVRGDALDIMIYLIDNHRKTANLILDSISKDLLIVRDDVKSTLYQALKLIAERRRRLVPDILNNLLNDHENQDVAVRIAVNDALTSSVEKLSQSRELGSTLKLLNRLLSNVLKAANHSNPAVRKSAYEAITIICVALPDQKIAKRGRTSIDRALKHEKDVGLTDFLEKCRIKAVRPLSF